MAGSYCGKNCDSCIQKECLECQGCRLGPGKSWGGDCEIAACCRDKGHDTCDTCTNSRYCGKHSRRDGMIERRAQKLAEKTEKQAELARKAPFFGKWLWILFWLWIPSAVAGVMTADVVVTAFPALALPGEILNLICSLAYALILLRMASEGERYRTAGILRIVAVAASFLVSLFGEANWTLIISLPGAVVGLIAEYQELMSHGAGLSDFDDELSGKWYRLWKWFIGVYIALIGSIVVMLIFPVLGLLVALAALIGMVVVSILKLVYLYRSAKEFRYYS